MSKTLIIEKNIPVPSGRKITEFGIVANQMGPGDSVGNLSAYYASKLVASLGSKGKQGVSRGEIGGLRRVWCLGPKP